MKGWKEEKVVPCKTNEWFAEGKECRAINSTVATMRGFTSHGARRTQERHGTIAPISKVVGYLTAGGAGGSTGGAGGAAGDAQEAQAVRPTLR